MSYAHNYRKNNDKRSGCDENEIKRANEIFTCYADDEQIMCDLCQITSLFFKLFARFFWLGKNPVYFDPCSASTHFRAIKSVKTLVQREHKIFEYEVECLMHRESHHVFAQLAQMQSANAQPAPWANENSKNWNQSRSSEKNTRPIAVRKTHRSRPNFFC